MKIKCPSCGFENEKEARFCEKCKEPLPNPYIKKKNNEDQSFKPTPGEEAETKNRIEKEERIRAEAKVKAEKEIKEKKQKKQGTGCLVLLAIVGVIFLIYFLPAIKADKEFREKPIPYVSSEGTIERIVEGVAVKAFGKTVNWDNTPYTVKGITKYKQTGGLDEGGYLVEVSYRANDNLTVSLIRNGIFMDAIKFSKELYSPSFCEEIKIYMLKPYLILTDKYGKEKEVQVAKLVLRRAIANKINWENITSEGFERILRDEGQLWIHPALTE